MTFANRLMAGGAGTNATRHRGLEDWRRQRQRY